MFSKDFEVAAMGELQELEWKYDPGSLCHW